MKTLADFKRLPVGTILSLSKAIDWDGREWTDHKGLKTPRKIAHKQTNAIKFEDGSWLEYPPASICEVNGNTLSILFERDPEYKSKMQLHYTIV